MPVYKVKPFLGDGGSGGGGCVLVDELPRVGEENILYKLPDGTIWSCVNSTETKVVCDLEVGKSYKLVESISYEDLSYLLYNVIPNQISMIEGEEYPGFKQEIDAETNDNTFSYNLSEDESAEYFLPDEKVSDTINIELTDLIEIPEVEITQYFIDNLNGDPSIEELIPLFQNSSHEETYVVSEWSQVNDGGGAQIVDALPAQGVEGTTYLLRKTEEHVGFKMYSILYGPNEGSNIIVSDEYTQEDIYKALWDKIGIDPDNVPSWLRISTLQVPEVMTTEEFENNVLSLEGVEVVTTEEEVLALNLNNVSSILQLQEGGLEIFKVLQQGSHSAYLSAIYANVFNFLYKIEETEEKILQENYRSINNVEGQAVFSEWNVQEFGTNDQTLIDTYNNDEEYWISAPAGTYNTITLTPETPTYTYSYTEYVFDKGVYTEVSAKSEGGDTEVVPNPEFTDSAQDLNYVDINDSQYSLPLHTVRVSATNYNSFPMTIALSWSESTLNELYNNSESIIRNVSINLYCPYTTGGVTNVILIPADKINCKWASGIVGGYYYEASLTLGSSGFLTIDKVAVSGENSFISLKVANIQSLTDSQVEDLRLGDVVLQTSNNRLYYVTDASNGRILSCTYTDSNASQGELTAGDIYIEAVAYYYDSAWYYNTTVTKKIEEPTVNNPTITFTQGGTTKGTITLNQSSNQTIELDAGGEIDVVTGHSSTWSTKTWTGLTSFLCGGIWTDGENVYYSNNTYQYVLNRATSTWSTKTWNGYSNLSGSSIWTDGTDIYYSFGSTQYVLNKSTSTWSIKTWNGLTSFDGQYIWTDGDNVYYSYNGNNYVLDKSTSTWSEKTWTGLTNFNGNDIWTDGTNIYYSSYTNQYVLNKSTSTWSNKSWYGYNNLDGRNIWSDGTNIYYSSGSTQKYLKKDNSTWSNKSWSGYSSFEGRYIWIDNDHIYYSNLSTQYELNITTHSVKVLSKVAETGDYNDLHNKPTVNNAQVTLTQGGVTKGSFKLNQSSNQTIELDAGGSGDSSLLATTKTRLDTTEDWIELDFLIYPRISEYIDFQGQYIWTDGDNIYFSYITTHYVLNKSTSTWVAKLWLGLTDFYGHNVWTDGENIYYSYGTDYQYILDKSTSTWEVKTWSGLTDFYGDYIWTDGTDIYYSSGTSQYILHKSTSTWEVKTWIGLTSFYGSFVWTDGTDIYYSSGTSQYVLNKSTSTWTEKTWTGLTSFSGEYIWTDGDNVYCANWFNHYVLDKSTSTWSSKTWSGLNFGFYGQYIWTDGDNVYLNNYNNGITSFLLNKNKTVSSKVILGNPVNSCASHTQPTVFSQLEFSKQILGFDNTVTLDPSNLTALVSNKNILDNVFDGGSPFITTDTPGDVEIVICPNYKQDGSGVHNALFSIYVDYESDNNYTIKICNWVSNSGDPTIIWSEQVTLDTDYDLGGFMGFLYNKLNASETKIEFTLQDTLNATGQIPDLYINSIVIYRGAINDYEVRRVTDVDSLIRALIVEPASSSSSSD